MTEAQVSYRSVPISDLDALVRLCDHLAERVNEAFADGYRLAYEAGYEHGEVQAELADARRHEAVRQAIADIGRDDWEARVRRAEAHGQAMALHQWSRHAAWDAVMAANPGMAVAIARLAGRP